jgi:hypothetical protein
VVFIHSWSLFTGLYYRLNNTFDMHIRRRCNGKCNFLVNEMYWLTKDDSKCQTLACLESGEFVSLLVFSIMCEVAKMFKKAFTCKSTVLFCGCVFLRIQVEQSKQRENPFLSDSNVFYWQFNRTTVNVT